MPDRKFADKKQGVKLISQMGNQFAVIHNPDYIFPPIEICPLSAPVNLPLPDIKAIVMDMDGTTTTTETLCLHSLEFMVRRISGRPTNADWNGLDIQTDYPHIIGNSTTRHVEYLIRTYATQIQPELLESAFLEAALWFIACGKDQKRVAEVKTNLIHFGYRDLLSDPDLLLAVEAAEISEVQFRIMAKRYRQMGRKWSFNDQVRAAIDIYYQRYHRILGDLALGRGAEIANDLLGDPEKGLIEPMPGIAVFLAMVKGWLGKEIVHLLPDLLNAYVEKIGPGEIKSITDDLLHLSLHFEGQPLKVAVVTSSIRYEANIVLQEVFRVIGNQVQEWPLADKRKKELVEKFNDLHHVYDGFITASDSSEIRLKPHRDLYSLALHQLGIPKEDFDKVIGFEDSESGTIAIRTAGIGLCIAVPFSETKHHNFEAASLVAQGGIPEVLIKHNLFLGR